MRRPILAALIGMALLAGCGSTAPAAQTVTATVTTAATSATPTVPVREVYQSICDTPADGGGSVCGVLDVFSATRSCGNMDGCGKMVRNSESLVGKVVAGLAAAGLTEVDPTLGAAVDHHQDAVKKWNAINCDGLVAGVTGQAPASAAPCAVYALTIQKSAGEVGSRLRELG